MSTDIGAPLLEHDDISNHKSAYTMADMKNKAASIDPDEVKKRADRFTKENQKIVDDVSVQWDLGFLDCKNRCIRVLILILIAFDIFSVCYLIFKFGTIFEVNKCLLI